jgi:hypothetical protein
MTKKPKPKKAAKRKAEPRKPDYEDLLAAINRDPAVLDGVLAVKCDDVLNKGDTFPIVLLPLLLLRFHALHTKSVKLLPRAPGGQTSDAARGMAMMIDGLGMGTAKAARAISKETGISPEAAIKAYSRFKKNFPAKKRRPAKTLHPR